MSAVFTDAGAALMTQLWARVTTAPTQWYIGWGTGSSTPTKASTNVSVPATESRVAVALTFDVDSVTFTGTLTCIGGNKTITNVGIFTAIAGGSMVLLSDHTSRSLVPGDSINYVFTLQFA